MSDHTEKAIEAVSDTAKAVKSVTDFASTVYEDALQPGAKVIGNSLEVIAQTVDKSLLPLRIYVWGMDRIEQMLRERLKEKLKDIPVERIIEPNPAIAGPVVEALRFTAEQQTIRDLFINLLATAMDSDTAKNAHPAFVEIIKQLSPDEAHILNYLGTSEGIFPIIDVRSSKDNRDETFLVHRFNFSLLGIKAGCSYPDLTVSYLDNLSRLGLISISDTQYQYELVYEPLETHAEIRKVLDEILNLKRNRDFIRKSLTVTSLGKAFISVCLALSNYEGRSIPMKEEPIITAQPPEAFFRNI